MGRRRKRCAARLVIVVITIWLEAGRRVCLCGVEHADCRWGKRRNEQATAREQASSGTETLLSMGQASKRPDDNSAWRFAFKLDAERSGPGPSAPHQGGAVDPAESADPVIVQVPASLPHTKAAAPPALAPQALSPAIPGPLRHEPRRCPSSMRSSDRNQRTRHPRRRDRD